MSKLIFILPLAIIAIISCVYAFAQQGFLAEQKKYAKNQELIDFWANLKIGYDKFVWEKKALNESIDNLGNYVF